MDEATKKIVNDEYQRGVAPVNIARQHRLDVSEVLDAIGQGEMTRVTFMGDLVDQSEVLPGTPINQLGDTYNVPYSTN